VLLTYASTAANFLCSEACRPWPAELGETLQGLLAAIVHYATSTARSPLPHPPPLLSLACRARRNAAGSAGRCCTSRHQQGETHPLPPRDPRCLPPT